MKLEKRFIIILLAIFIVLAAVLAVTPTLARYIRGTADAENEFESKGSEKPSVINGELNDGKLEGVSFNVGATGYPVYVRVKVLVTWKDKDGNVLYVAPINREDAEKNAKENAEIEYDYEVTYNLDDWTPESDGYWYFTGSDSKNKENPDYLNGAVKSGKTTTALVETFEYNDTQPPRDGYKLNVEFIVQTVQAVGHTDEDNEAGEILAMEDAWKNYGQTEEEPDTETGSGTENDSGTGDDSDNG